MAAIQLSTESAIRRSLPFSPPTPAAAQLDATTGTQVAHASSTLRGTPEPQLRGARATVADARTRVRSGGSTISEAPARLSSRRRVAEGRDPAQINRRPGRAASSGDQTSFTNQRRASSLTKYPEVAAEDEGLFRRGLYFRLAQRHRNRDCSQTGGQVRAESRRHVLPISICY